MQQGVDQRAGRIARAGMHDQPGRLVDDDHMFVFVEHVQRDVFRLREGLDIQHDRQTDRLPAVHRIAGSHLATVQQCVAGFDPFSQPRA